MHTLSRGKNISIHFTDDELSLLKQWEKYCKNHYTTKSGWVKLATELSKRATGKTLYLIDEPTTGLSFYDVHKLMDVIQRLVDKGNSVLVIEHNLDVIRCSDGSSISVRKVEIKAVRSW